MTQPLLALEDVRVRYGAGQGAVTAVDGASLAIPQGTTHGLVGESGSGKSSIARAIVGLAPLAGGTIRLDGVPVDPGTRGGAAAVRPRVQMVFQNPYASLNPRMTVGAMLAEALMLHRPEIGDRKAEATATVARVGFDAACLHRYPHQFSGGQRQRLAIARALATAAPVLILDEVTSALDVSVQAAVLNLLKDLQRERGLTYLFISHDLAAVRHVSDAVSVMYLGRIVETAPRDALFSAPRHPYSEGLLAAVPAVPARPAGTARPVEGEIGDPRRPPGGCRFHPRCPLAQADTQLMARCATLAPPLIGQASRVACHARAPATAAPHD
jgi:peptide/nickel transport system ATP-binding protein